MFCFRCGQQLPPKGNLCPACDMPQKRRQRYRRRLLLGLFIFLAGAMVGSLCDSLLFDGKSWSRFAFQKPDLVTTASEPQAVGAPPLESPGNPASLPVALPGEPPVSVDPLAGDEPVLPAIPRDTTASPAVSPDPVAPSVPEASPAVAVATPLASEPGPFNAPRPPIPDGRLVFKTAETLIDGEGNNYHGILSSDDRVLLFSSNRPADGDPTRYQAYMRDMAGKGGATRLFRWEGNVWTPEFTPDGNAVVFSSDSQKPEQIFLFERVSLTGRALTAGESKNMMPAISPDGTMVAFVSNRKGNNDIWLVGVDGKNLIQITSGPEDDREPRWWPDGRSLVFTRIAEKLKVSHLMRVPLDPQGPPEALVKDGKRNWLPDVSPDGRFLAFVRSREPDGSGNVLVVRRLENGEEQVVTPGKGSEQYRPIWTPDGNGLVFHADVKDRKQLFLARFTRQPRP